MVNTTRSTDRIHRDHQRHLKTMMMYGIPMAPEERSRKAYDLVQRAYQSPSPSTQSYLAREALKLWDDSTDAYNLLAANATVAEVLAESKALYEEAIRSIHRLFTPDDIEKAVGNFYLHPEFHPYMRALKGLGKTEWRMGLYSEALQTLNTLLLGDPSDYYGVTSIIDLILLELRDLSGFETFVKEHASEDQDTTSRKFNLALACFIKESHSYDSGNPNRPRGQASRAANRLLKDAMVSNEHVIAFMMDDRDMPKVLALPIRKHSADEAAEYVADAKVVWHFQEKALDWLMRQY